MFDFRKPLLAALLAVVLTARVCLAQNSSPMVPSGGAAASGANSDITSLSGLTTPLSAAQGGAGVTPPGAWTAWTPTITSGAGTITTATASGRYVVIAGKTLLFTITVTITTNGTGSSFVRATMPFAAQARAFEVGRDTNTTFAPLFGDIAAGGSSMNIFFLSSSLTYPGANGVILMLSGSYETQ